MSAWCAILFASIVFPTPFGPTRTIFAASWMKSSVKTASIAPRSHRTLSRRLVPEVLEKLLLFGLQDLELVACRSGSGEAVKGLRTLMRFIRSEERRVGQE